MPLYPFPDVPNVAGVPALIRSSANPPSNNVPIGSAAPALTSASQNVSQWGIYSSDGTDQLGMLSSGLVGTNTSSAFTITNAFEFRRETNMPTFPTEGGSFANYNKVILPATPTVTLVFSGSESERSSFLSVIDQACQSTDTYSIVTPEITYANYSLLRYNLRRAPDEGATLLIVEIAMLEVRSVSAAYTTAASTQINAPQNVGSNAQVNSGNVQPQTPDTSTFKSLYNNFNALGGGS